jgi:tRNA G46 methylase TrmB
LFKPGAPERFATLLTSGGVIHLRTDVENYFQVMTELFDTCGLFVRIDPPPELLSCLTGFERRFVAEGKPIYRVSYRLANDRVTDH